MEIKKIVIYICPICSRMKKYSEWIKWSELTPEEFNKLSHLHDKGLIETNKSLTCQSCK